MDSLYLRIMSELNRHNMTGKDLGKSLDLKKSPLTDWKNGKSKPTLEQLVKMCEIFATSADYLLFGSLGNFLSSEDLTLLTRFKKLSTDDQEELLDIIALKLQRYQKKTGANDKLYPSSDEDFNNIFAG